MSYATNVIYIKAAFAAANKHNDGTLHNWATEFAMHNNNEYVSVDITNDELDDTVEADMKALGYDTETVFNMTDFDARKTGRAFIYEAMENAGDKRKVIAAYMKAVRRRMKWLDKR